MTWELVEQLLMLAGQPAIQLAFTACLAPVAALIVGAQARRLGLDAVHIPGLSRFRFPALFATLAFWTTLLLGGQLAIGGGWELGWLLELALKAFLAAGVAALGCVAANSLAELASESRVNKTRELLDSLRPGATLGGLGLAALVLADVGAFAGVLLLAVGAWLYLRDDERRAMTWTLVDNTMARLKAPPDDESDAA